MNHDHDRSAHYKEDSLTLSGAVSMGTGVMIGAGIFALTGQVAELARGWFPLAFLAAAVIAGFSAYSYVKMSNAYPSAGGIAMFLEKAYGKTLMTAGCALLMYFPWLSMKALWRAHLALIRCSSSTGIKIAGWFQRWVSEF